MTSIVVGDCIVPFILFHVFERWNAKLIGVRWVLAGLPRQHEADEHLKVWLALDLGLMREIMRVGRVVSKVGALAIGPKVSKPDVKPLLALIDYFGVNATSA